MKAFEKKLMPMNQLFPPSYYNVCNDKIIFSSSIEKQTNSIINFKLQDSTNTEEVT